MKKSDRTFVISAVFAAASALAYTSAVWFQIPLPVYYPLDHAWKMTRQAGVPTMSWYGNAGFALGVSGLVALTLSRVLCAVRQGVVPPAGLRGLAVFSLLIVTGCAISLAIHEGHWFR